MFAFNSKINGGMRVLAVILSLAALGCQSRTIRNPTFANFGSHLREGNRVKLVLKNGIRQTAKVTTIRTDGIMVNGDQNIAYGDMQRGCRVLDEGDPVTKTIDGLGCVIEPVCAVVYVVGRILVPVFGGGR